MKGTTFGICECGFSKASHVAGSRPKSLKKPLAPVSAAPAAVSKPPPPAAKSVEAPTASSSSATSAGDSNASSSSGGKAERPCNNYQLDMKAATFGACKCGWAKADHGKADSDLPAKVDLRKPSIVGGTSVGALSPKTDLRKPSIVGTTSFTSKGKSSPKTETRKQSIVGSPKTTGKKGASPAQTVKKSPKTEVDRKSVV